MGRHNLPEEYGAESTEPHPGVRRRAVAIAVVLVLCVTAGAAVAYQGGWLSNSSCEDDAVALDVAASPDVAPALRAAADYSRQNDVMSDGHCMEITVVAQDSYRTAGLLRNGKKDPGIDVWVPDSQMWVQGTQDSGTSVPLTSAGNIASTPLALATVAEAAEKLDWPRKTYAWSELADAAFKDKKIHLGAADPMRSATGLLALTKLGTSKGNPATPGDSRGAQLINALQDHMREGDPKVLDTLAPDGGDRRPNDALIITEQASFAHNKATKKASEDVKLFYPRDGSPQLDYPYTLVNETAMTTDESRAALRFMTLLGEETGKRILHDHGFRTAPDTPTTEMVAAAGGRAPQPFADFNGEQPNPSEIQESLGLWTLTVQSARLTMLVDTSSSMGRLVPEKGLSRMELTKKALLYGLDTSRDQDEFGLWEFATDVHGTRDYRKVIATKPLGGSQRGDLKEGFQNLEPTSASTTGLYDSVLAAYTDIRSTYAKGKFNALVVVTDGGNDTGNLTRSGLVHKLEDLADPERPVPVIAIAVGPDADKDDTEKIAAATQGSSHQITDPSEINSVLLRAIMQATMRGGH